MIRGLLRKRTASTHGTAVFVHAVMVLDENMDSVAVYATVQARFRFDG